MKYVFTYFLPILATTHSINCMEGLGGFKDIDLAQLAKDVAEYSRQENKKAEVFLYSKYTGAKSFYDPQIERAYKEGNGLRIEELVQKNPRLLPFLRHVIQDSEQRVAWAKNLVQHLEQQQTDEQQKKEVTGRIQHGKGSLQERKKVQAKL